MASKIIIQSSDGLPSSEGRQVSIFDHSTKELIQTTQTDFINGYGVVESFVIQPEAELLLYAPENGDFGVSEKALVNEQTSSSWGSGEPTVLHTVLVSGQSLSIAQESIATNTDELLGGFLYNGIDSGGRGDNSASTSQMASLVPFVNTDVESHGYSFISLFRRLQKEEANINDPILWACNGIGGKTVDYLFNETGTAVKNAGYYIGRADSRAADINLLPSLPFWLWDQGESDTNNDPETYKTSLRSGHDAMTALALAETGQETYPMILTGIGSATGRREINNALYQYTEENDDAYYACNKWYISANYPAGGGDTTHMQAKGYMMQGEYHALAAHKLMMSKAAGDNPPISKCLQPESYAASGTSVTISMHVPVSPMVIDTTTIPALTGWGFKYIAVSGTETVATSVTVSGDDLIIDFGVTLETGGVLDFGYADTQLGTPALNVRDSQSIPSIVDGEILYNWFPVFYHALEASEVA